MRNQSIRSLFNFGERLRIQIDSAWDHNSSTYQQSIAEAIATYEQCLELIDRLSIFSPNETLDDITSCELQYLSINYRLAELILRRTDKDRHAIIQTARVAFERYINLLDQYDLLSYSEKRLYERYTECPTKFSTISTNNLDTRRDIKIANFRLEKELKRKLESLSQNTAYLENDEDALREFHLTNISFCTHNTFQALESLNRELEVLKMAPPSPPNSLNSLERDNRERMANDEKTVIWSDRLDALTDFSSANNSPILDSNGKPLRPFTLLDSRQSLRKGVFRPGHNLPTMTIDEYLEEERARGGIIEGGGEASGVRPQSDEDNFHLADEETMKAREWDEFKESNHKGSGNTLNRG